MYKNTPHPNPLPQGERESRRSWRWDTFQGWRPTKGNWLGRETHPSMCAVGRPAHNDGEGEQAGRLFNTAMGNAGETPAPLYVVGGESLRKNMHSAKRTQIENAKLSLHVSGR
jgi:hypothetical protein